ncbi:MAG: PQQ-binding-like beta-propeller repeat protein [Actinobacteria bacterium]|nr:PQQ-binding-like beta-propeller repeat protein [Actinomycetota bacterium]MBI3687795.1 PQQ-binding-like beta-propeller repeat protein [Actinomycetota bacterium]
MKAHRRIVLFGTVLATLGGLTTLVVPVVGGSDLVNTTLHAAAATPARPVTAALPAALRQIWSAPGVPPRAGSPLPTDTTHSSVVAVAGSHGIEGRSLLDGAIVWSYERRNAALCDWTLQQDLVLVAFRKLDGCRDLVALDAGTGVRRWYRTAEIDADITLYAAPALLVAANSRGLAAFDTGGGLTRWTFGRPGCTLAPPILGDQGVALLLACAGRPPSLVLLDTYSGKERWKLPVPMTGIDPRVLAADTDVTVLTRSGGAAVITAYDNSGRRLSATGIGVRYGTASQVATMVHNGVVVGWTGRQVFAAATAGTPLWTADGTGPAVGDGPVVLLAGPGPLTERDPRSGRVVRTIPRPAGSAGPEDVGRLGSSLVTITTAGTIVLGGTPR